MGADIGYLQTKISQLSDKVEKIESENIKMKLVLEEKEKTFTQLESKFKNIINDMQKSVIEVSQRKFLENMQKPLKTFGAIILKDMNKNSLILKKQFEKQQEAVSNELELLNKTTNRSLRSIEDGWTENFKKCFNQFAEENNLNKLSFGIKRGKTEIVSLKNNKKVYDEVKDNSKLQELK